MTALFDGMAGALNEVFGAPVLYRPLVGTNAVIQSVFRTEPVTVLDQDGGSVVIAEPTWRVPKDKASGAVRGDLIEPGDSKTYRILRRIPNPSPATDAFAVFALEEVV
jgi:hypothetical protein